MRRHSIKSTTKPKPEIVTIANAQDKERWTLDTIGHAKIRGGSRRRNRENGFAPIAKEKGNAADGEQAVKSHRHREGLHALPIDDYMVYTLTFSLKH
jgi:hypothetical protein